MEQATSAFGQAVAAAAQDTPYTVVPTRKGFDVHLDIADSRWWGLFNRAGLRSAFRWRVVERPSSFSITDRQIRVSWIAGVPRFGFTWQMQSGRILTLRREKIWALSDRGRIEPVVDYRFSAKEGRDLIRLVAAQLGLKERQPLSVKMTWFFVLITPAFFAVYGLIQLVLRLLGTH